MYVLLLHTISFRLGAALLWYSFVLLVLPDLEESFPSLLRLVEPRRLSLVLLLLIVEPRRFESLVLLLTVPDARRLTDRLMLSVLESLSRLFLGG